MMIKVYIYIYIYIYIYMRILFETVLVAVAENIRETPQLGSRYSCQEDDEETGETRTR